MFILNNLGIHDKYCALAKTVYQRFVFCTYDCYDDYNKLVYSYYNHRKPRGLDCGSY